MPSSQPKHAQILLAQASQPEGAFTTSGPPAFLLERANNFRGQPTKIAPDFMKQVVNMNEAELYATLGVQQQVPLLSPQEEKLIRGLFEQRRKERETGAPSERGS